MYVCMCVFVHAHARVRVRVLMPDMRVCFCDSCAGDLHQETG